MLTHSHSHTFTLTLTLTLPCSHIHAHHTGGIRNCGNLNSNVLSWEGCDYSIMIKFQDYEDFIILHIPVSQNYSAISRDQWGPFSRGGGDSQKFVLKPGLGTVWRGIKTA